MEATEHVIAQIEGAYAFAVMVTDYPDHLASTAGLPLATGYPMMRYFWFRCYCYG